MAYSFLVSELADSVIELASDHRPRPSSAGPRERICQDRDRIIGRRRTRAGLLSVSGL
jgi:hypothetical protein